ncbi:MAG TPA: GIY-YIG nuclease family protein [Aequorivita sp.]|nr:GIY-YIG nuclease family protein [Aequorivita sp.]
MYFLYILYSIHLDRYYVGSTEDISMRLKEHLWSHKGFTSKAKDWELKYSESFESKIEAMARERQIKKWKSRRLIEKLISSSD